MSYKSLMFSSDGKKVAYIDPPSIALRFGAEYISRIIGQANDPGGRNLRELSDFGKWHRRSALEDIRKLRMP
jgi:hypothetical protein